MYVETQIKTRPSTDVDWCSDLESDYLRITTEVFRADGRLVNVTFQMSEDRLQFTQTYLFRSEETRNAFYSDPILIEINKFTTAYDNASGIISRMVVDRSA